MSLPLPTKLMRRSSAQPGAVPWLCLISVWALLSVGCAGVTGTVVKNSAPTVSITSPVAGTAVSGTTTITVSVSATTTSVQFMVDGNRTGSAVTTAPFSYSLNTTTLSNGSHSLTAVASNAGGQTAASAAVSIKVSNANPPPPTLPAISITSPVSGTTVSGTITVTASASGNITSVLFMVDGNPAAVTNAPFSYSLNTAALSNGSRSLTARASTAAGQTATSAAVSINVNNANPIPPAPPSVSITSPVSGATISGTTTVTVSVSANTTSVQFLVDGNPAAVTNAPFSYSLNTATLSNGSHSLAAKASTVAGQTATSAAVSININNANPPMPPAISITSPLPSATVFGTINVAANATDSAGVARVEFYLDNSLQATDTSSPYAWTWNTTSAVNGSHTIMAKAYDAAGNASTASVTITVSNTGGGGGLTPSGPITVSGQTGVVVQGLHITNPNGDCVTITNSTSITIRQSEIGPCSGNGIVINNGNTINVFDNYIHPEGTLAGCCDVTDGIFANGTQKLTVQGNVIAYGEANIEAQNQTNITIVGNFFLNPRNSGDRGQNIQVFYGSSSVLVENNYALASVNTALYKFAESQEDSINFGASATGNFTSGIIARNNYITGGHSASGCGLIADTGANSAQFLSNTLVDTGQCGIGIADGTNHVIDSNKILNNTPVIGGGNNAIYVWKVNSSDPPCGPVQISNNIASAIASDGSANSFWNGGGCEPVTMTNNTFDAAAQQALSPATVKLPPPPIPPQPNTCVIASPFTNNTSLPACGGSGSGGGGGGNTPPTVAITSPASGVTVSGTITISTNVSTNTTNVQFNVDGTSAGPAVTSAPFSFSLNTTTLSSGSHSLTAVASNAGGQTTTSAAVSINVNNPHLGITTATLPSGQVQVSYSATLKAAGGTPPYTWSVLSGQLPTGLILSSSGTISGTPNLAGSFTLSIGVKDSAGLSTSSVFSINIATPPPSPTAPFGHVIVVVEENANYSDVIGSSSAPYMNSLANQYGLATQYYADTHPSIGNYLAITTGQILTNDDGQTPQSFPVSADNSVRELLAAGKTWKAYAESIPSVGYVGGDATGPDGGQFYTRHAPLPYMTDVQNSAAQRQNIVPFTKFTIDLANNALPNYSFISPNGCDDAHDCGLDVADNWLKTNIDPLIKSALFQKDGLLIIVFDESNTDNTNGGGRVAAIVISPFAKLGFRSTTLYQHESLLGLTLEGLGVTTLPAPAASAPKMWEFFTFTPPS
jgi:hypothetical protein